MTFYQRKLTDEDLKTIEDHGIRNDNRRSD